MKFDEFISRIKPKICDGAKNTVTINTDALIVSESDAFEMIDNNDNGLHGCDIVVDSDYLLSSNIAVAEKYKALTEFTSSKNITHLKMTESGTICNAVMNSSGFHADKVYASVSCKVVAPYFENEIIALPGSAREISFKNAVKLVVVNVNDDLVNDVEPETLSFNIIAELNKSGIKQDKSGMLVVLFKSSAYQALGKQNRIKAFSILNSFDFLAFECDDVRAAIDSANEIFSSIDVKTLNITEMHNLCMLHNQISAEITENVDRIFLGGCASGDFETLQAIADYTTGKTLRKNLEVIITPADFTVYQLAAKSGILTKLSNAGFTIVFPSCASCKGNHSGILASGEIAFSTFPLAEPGRMGHMNAQIYRCSVKSILENIMI